MSLARYVHFMFSSCFHFPFVSLKEENKGVVVLSLQAKPETVQKVCEIVKKQLALPAESELTPESKFAALGADSLDTVRPIYFFIF